MRYVIGFALAVVLSQVALTHAPGAPPPAIPGSVPAVKFQPFMPPKPAPPGTSIPLIIFPNLQAYNASGVFWAGPDNSNYTAVYVQPQPIPQPPVFMPLPPPPPDNRARITLQLPRASAEVWVEGQKLEQTGASRRFVSPVLDPYRSYAYNIRVRWYDEGKEKTHTLRVPVKANDEPEVTIVGPSAAN